MCSFHFMSPLCLQVERAVLDLCLDPSDSYLAAVAVDISSIENNVSSSVRLYEVGRQRPAAGDDDDDSDGAADEVTWVAFHCTCLFFEAA
jgi:hypothetical protein